MRTVQECAALCGLPPVSEAESPRLPPCPHYPLLSPLHLAHLYVPLKKVIQWQLLLVHRGLHKVRVTLFTICMSSF